MAVVVSVIFSHKPLSKFNNTLFQNPYVPHFKSRYLIKTSALKMEYPILSFIIFL